MKAWSTLHHRDLLIEAVGHTHSGRQVPQRQDFICSYLNAPQLLAPLADVQLRYWSCREKGANALARDTDLGSKRRQQREILFPVGRIKIPWKRLTELASFQNYPWLFKPVDEEQWRQSTRVKGAALEGEVTAGNEAMKAAQGPVNWTSFFFKFISLFERERTWV